MHVRDLSSLMRFVLASTAAAACGGLVEPRDDDSPTAPDDDTRCFGLECRPDVASSSSSGDPDPDPDPTSSSSSSSGSTSGSSGSTSSSSGSFSCESGEIAFDEAFCCPDGETCPDAAGGASPEPKPVCVLDCARVCARVGQGDGFQYCGWSETADKVSYTCGACGVGRIAAGTAPHEIGDTLGERLARQAYYEAASVTAFARLARVLAAAEAPWDLVRRAQRAAEEEARHAATFAALAEKHGATPCAPEAGDSLPTLFELAMENATEGGVRETFGALLTLHQAEHAESAEVRAAFASIAEDELQHAALSWDLFAWFDTQLGPEERSMMQDAYVIARRAAERDVASAPDALGVAVGLPDAPRARAMFADLMRGLDSLRGTRLAA